MRRWGPRLLLSIAAVSMTLLLSEAGLRLAGSATRRSGELRPRLIRGRTVGSLTYFSPGYSGRLVSPEFDVPVSVNEQGFRERELAGDRLAAVHPYLFIGDSFFWGWGVERRERVSERFAAALAAGGHPVPALNLSMPGWGARRYSEITEMFSARLQPRLVIVGLFVGNDFLDDSRSLRDGDRWNEGGRLRRFLRSSALLSLLKRSLWSLGDFRHLFNGLDLRNDRIVLYEVEDSERQRQLYRTTLAALDRLAEVSRSTATPVLVALLPDHLQVLEPGLFADYDIDRPQRILARHLDSLGLPWVDLLAAFQAVPDAERMYYREDKHWTASGHDLAARVILPRAVELATTYGVEGLPLPDLAGTDSARPVVDRSRARTAGVPVGLRHKG